MDAVAGGGRATRHVRGNRMGVFQALGGGGGRRRRQLGASALCSQQARCPCWPGAASVAYLRGGHPSTTHPPPLWDTGYVRGRAGDARAAAPSHARVAKGLWRGCTQRLLVLPTCDGPSGGARAGPTRICQAGGRWEIHQLCMRSVAVLQSARAAFTCSAPSRGA